MQYRFLIYVLFLWGMGGILHATPEEWDGLYWGWDTPSALGISAADAKKEIARFNHPDVKLQGDFPIYAIKLKSADLIVGRIRYDALNAEISIYTFLPHGIPEKRRNSIGAFFKALNEDKDFSEFQWGHYYVNPDSGECGFVRRLTSLRQLHGNPPPSQTASQELSEHWEDCHLYELYPEITKALYGNASVSRLMYTVKAFPPVDRTHGKLEDMQLHRIPEHPNEPDVQVEHRFDDSIRPDSKKIKEALFRHFKERDERLKPYLGRLTKYLQTKDANGIYLLGNEANKNAEMWFAFDCYKYAALQGHSRAMFEAGMAERFEGAVDMAVMYFRKAAAQNVPDAKRYLAWMLEEWPGQDDAEIFQLYSEALRDGYEDAAIDVARCHWYGIGTSVDHKRSYEVIEPYWKKYPDSKRSNLLIGMWHFYHGDREKGLKLILAVPWKISWAAFELGKIYEFGLRGIPQRINVANNFNIYWGETRYYWLNEYDLNARQQKELDQILY